MTDFGKTNSLPEDRTGAYSICEAGSLLRAWYERMELKLFIELNLSTE